METKLKEKTSFFNLLISVIVFGDVEEAGVPVSRWGGVLPAQRHDNLGRAQSDTWGRQGQAVRVGYIFEKSVGFLLNSLSCNDVSRAKEKLAHMPPIKRWKRKNWLFRIFLEL